jgi:hypothetical protein
MTDPIVPKTPPDEGGKTRFDLSTMREVEPSPDDGDPLALLREAERRTEGQR